MKKLTQTQWIGVGVALVVALGLFYYGSDSIFGTKSSQTAAVAGADQNANQTPVNIINKNVTNISTIKGLEIYDEAVGTGDTVVAGKEIAVHYIGTLTNGTKFDSSLDRKQPFIFTLGAGQVIKGWDLGVAGMKVGGVRKLVISPELGYGSQVAGTIPANSTLVFEVQLLGINPNK